MTTEQELHAALSQLIEARKNTIKAQDALRQQERRSKAGKAEWDKLSWAEFYARKAEVEAENIAEGLLLRLDSVEA
jgi:hypothetical protein